MPWEKQEVNQEHARADYRKLNDITQMDSYPLPKVNDRLDSLLVAKWFSTVDLKTEYWQVELYTENKEAAFSIALST